ncbi:hypothetical protein [Catenovulum sediminis]|uniref:Integral membrane protein n=1 Tax=Catenovulum sediminis TaxID=1740262 RepID=A0ABV1RFV4_9ALTE|nr:hypothetical protein [Catenovulum sediminis]
MQRNLIVAVVIGAFLGIVIAISNIDESFVGLFTSIFLSVVAGLFTVYLIRNKPNLYALVAVITSAPFLLWGYGLNSGLVYLLGLSLVYGILSVQLFQALGIAKSNFNYLLHKFKSRE